jgi:methylated-DNA-[protein]-cysteine S-methyltransferase
MTRRRRPLSAILAGKRVTPFQRDVYEAVRAIGAGEVKTYKWVAAKIGRPKAYRAVGNALNRNPSPGTIPCHRVIKSNGSIGGFSRGVKAKIKMLRREGTKIDGHILC